MPKRQSETSRRPPQQARGRARVEQLLDVTERLLIKGGYDALTTNAVAAQAGISVGALYHFFPNKVAILEALVARYYAQLLAVLANVHAAAPALTAAHLERYVDTLLGALSDFVEGSPSLTPAFLAAASASPNLGAMDRENKAQTTALLAAHYAAGGNDDETAKRMARMVTAVLDMLFIETLGDDRAADKAFIEETGKLLYLYLSSYLTPAFDK